MHHAGWISNEDASIFRVANRRMDAVVAPNALMLASEEEYTLKGVMLDTFCIFTGACPLLF